MILKFNECYKKEIKKEIIYRSGLLISFLASSISQFLGDRRKLLLGFGIVCIFIASSLIIQVISIHKKIYIVLDSTDIIIDKKYINISEIHSISISDKSIVLKKINNRFYCGINLNWLSPQDKDYLIQYFNQINIKKQ